MSQRAQAQALGAHSACYLDRLVNLGLHMCPSGAPWLPQTPLWGLPCLPEAPSEKKNPCDWGWWKRGFWPVSGCSSLSG